MKAKIYLGIIITALCISFSGCGKKEKVAENTSTPVPETTQQVNNTESPASSETELPTESTPEITTEAPTKTPEIRTEKLTPSQDYTDTYRTIKVLGLKEYKKIKGDTYTDKAKNGKKFLVLFLSAKNVSGQEDYINYNFVSAKVDGKDIKHTVLANDPKGYPTFFTHIPAGKSIGGFIVWEIPSGWKKFQFIYNGWKDINNVSMKAEFTPEDLSDPVIYNANDFN